MPKSLVKKESKKKKGFNKKSLSNLRPIKKGEVRNPAGANAHNPLIKAFDKLHQIEYLTALERVLSASDAELEILCDPLLAGNTAMKRLIALAMQEALQRKDFSLLERLTDKLFGKDPLQLNVRTEEMPDKAVMIEAVKAAIVELKNEY